jgi:hypothetical protein
MNNPILIGIISSVVATVLISLSSSIFRKFKDKLFTYFIKKNAKFEDKIFKEAALRNRTEAVLFSASLILSLTMFIITAIITLGFGKSNEMIKEAEVYVNRTENINSEQSEQGLKEVSLAELKKDSMELLSQTKKTKVLMIVFAVLMIFYLVRLNFKHMRIWMINKYIMEFENKLYLIAPQVKNEIIIELNSLWVKMENKNDHEDIMRIIKEYEKH